MIAEEFPIPGAEQVVIFGSWAARCAGEAGPPPHDLDVLVLVLGKVDRADWIGHLHATEPQLRSGPTEGAPLSVCRLLSDKASAPS